MIDRFNIILSRFGGHRVKVKDFGRGWINFEIMYWGEFLLTYYDITECVDGDRIKTERSEWLTKVSKGQARDDAGRVG